MFKTILTITEASLCLVIIFPEYKNRDKLNTFIGIRLTVFSIFYAIHHIIVTHH
ncbi:hypothetical protein [uncultured Methanobrevibacter sp.]|uniref:hypothetical protein n=1 Tax=uncultured Methanobrevibacter sp. TaxID=253161 RepID=UPI0025D826B7|nr:hypothetical protein [uncultured Methanobrevibacter sp.]